MVLDLPFSFPGIYSIKRLFCLGAKDLLLAVLDLLRVVLDLLRVVLDLPIVVLDLPDFVLSAVSVVFADIHVVLDLPGLLLQVAADGHASGSGKFRVVLDLPSWFLIYLVFWKQGF